MYIYIYVYAYMEYTNAVVHASMYTYMYIHTW